MGVGLGIWLLRSWHDSQTARNSLFPDMVSSPEVFYAAMAFSMALDHVLLFTEVPLRNMIPSLVAISVTVGPVLAESVSAVAEGCSEWMEGQESPTQAQIQREIEVFREQLVNALPDVIQRRSELSQQMGVRFDRRLHAVILCVHELSYYDTYPVIDLLGQHLRTYQVEIQRALVRAELEASQ